jgi:hypothetical protein
MSCVFREQENAKILMDEGSVSADTPETMGILRAGGAHGQYMYRELNDFAIRFCIHTDPRLQRQHLIIRMEAKHPGDEHRQKRSLGNSSICLIWGEE